MSNRYDIEYADKTAILKVRDAQRCDRGEYQIQAINELGEDVTSIMVTIASKYTYLQYFLFDFRGCTVYLICVDK